MAKKRYTQNTREKHLQKQKDSGVNQALYCRQNKISLPTFNSWKKKYPPIPNPESRPSFLKFKIPKLVSESISVKLPNSITVKFETTIEASNLKNILTTILEIKPC